MPKSRVRGGKTKHRKRVINRNLLKKREEDKQRKLFMEQLQKIQEDAMKQQDANVVDAEDLGDLGLDDLGLNDVTTEQSTEQSTKQ
jgi:hypothetical protein